MTVVIAYCFLKYVAVIADCRVSYENIPQKDDNLQKIYQIDNRMVLGFSGPLEGAHQVIEFIKPNIESYKKPPIARNLENDVVRWMKHAYKEIRNPKHRKGLSFILATVEPRRESRSRFLTQDGREQPRSEWYSSVPELRALTLKPHKDRPEELCEERGGKIIIGVPVEIRNAIYDQLNKLVGFAMNQPQLQIIAVINSLMSLLMQENVETVGGLFQCAILSVNGIEWITHGSPNVSLYIEGGHYKQKNELTGEITPLLTLQEWMEKWRSQNIPGSAGAFEDPDLRKVALLSQLEMNPGICKYCPYAQPIDIQGNVYLQCEANKTNPKLPKYPELPVKICPENQSPLSNK